MRAIFNAERQVEQVRAEIKRRSHIDLSSAFDLMDSDKDEVLRPNDLRDFFA